MSPTARTLKLLRDDGWLADVVERWIPRAKIRKDLFGLIDILAIRDGEVLAVQTTTASNVTARRQKAEAHPNLPFVKEAMRFVIHGWRLRKLKGEKRGHWVCREVEL